MFFLKRDGHLSGRVILLELPGLVYRAREILEDGSEVDAAAGILHRERFWWLGSWWKVKFVKCEVVTKTADFEIFWRCMNHSLTIRMNTCHQVFWRTIGELWCPGSQSWKAELQSFSFSAHLKFGLWLWMTLTWPKKWWLMYIGDMPSWRSAPRLWNG